MAQASVSTLRMSAVPYLALLLIGVIGGQFLTYTFRSEPLWKAQSTGILFTLAFGAASFICWIILTPRSPMQRLPLLIIFGLTLLWCIATLRVVSQEGAFNYTALVTPTALLMLAFKPPEFKEALWFGDATVVGLSLSVVATQALDITGVRTNRADIMSRWDLPIDSLDPIFRWEGMFTDPNYAGFIGAFLLIYGLFRWKFRLSLWSTLCGSLVVFASESRSAFLAVTVGLSTFLIMKSTQVLRRSLIPRWLIVLTAAICLALPAFALVRFDPSLNGRVPIWHAVIRLTSENIFFGVGSDRIIEASQSALIPGANLDGHSVILDTLVRNGMPAGITVVLVLIGVSLLCLRNHPRDSGLSFGVFATFCTGALTYTVTTWQYPTVQILPLLAAVLIASPPLENTMSTEGDAPVRAE